MERGREEGWEGGRGRRRCVAAARRRVGCSGTHRRDEIRHRGVRVALHGARCEDRVELDEEVLVTHPARVGRVGVVRRERAHLHLRQLGDSRGLDGRAKFALRHEPGAQAVVVLEERAHPNAAAVDGLLQPAEQSGSVYVGEEVLCHH